MISLFNEEGDGIAALHARGAASRLEITSVEKESILPSAASSLIKDLGT